ncbi:MAG: hypothetical protein ACT4QF_15145 [Sporichthyaceae bacterium]
MTDAAIRAATAARSAERVADRLAYLTHPTPTRPVESTPAALDEADPAVLAWRSESRSAAENLVLAQFCAWCGDSPAELIERIFDRQTYSYRRRDHYRVQILEFCAAGGGSWEEQTARGEVVRGFFRANGHTIARPRPPWMIWAQLP